MNEPFWQQCDGYEEIAGRHVSITIEPRPSYCDRGAYLAKVWLRDLPTGRHPVHLDAADGWPRYYFDLTRAKLELEAWLRKRKQLASPADGVT